MSKYLKEKYPNEYATYEHYKKIHGYNYCEGLEDVLGLMRLHHKQQVKNCDLADVVHSTIMKNIISIMAFIIGLIAIPIQIVMIYEDNQRLLFIILMCLTVPGFINSFRHLMNKIHFKVDFRIDE